MLKIRLARVGKKKRPAYRFIISESSRDTYGKALEILGHYNPFSKVCEVNAERVKYWISVGAQMSPTVNNLFIAQNVISGEKVKASKAGKKKKGEPEAPAKPAPVAETPATEAPASEPAVEEAPAVAETPVEAPKEEAPAEAEAPKE